MAASDTVHAEVKAPSTPVSSAHGRLEWLDGLRAYAIVAVIGMHCGFVFGLPRHLTPLEDAFARATAVGQYGVQLFFVISALTVFYTLGRFPFSWQELRGWWVKRYFRIAPLYYMLIPVYFVVNGLVNVLRVHFHKPSLGNTQWVNVVENVFFAHAWIGSGMNSVIPGGWSIAVEMMFYVAAPLLFWIYRRGGVCFVVYPMIAIGALWLTLWLAGGHVTDNSYFFYWPPTQLPVFLCGLLLVKLTGSWLFQSGPVPRFAVRVASVLVLPVFLLGCWLGPYGDRNEAMAPAVLGVAFACLMVLARGPLRGAFSNRVAVWLGRISYSIYMVHFIVLYALHNLDTVLHLTWGLPVVLAWLVMVLGVTAGASLVACGTRIWIEEPGIHLGRRLARLAAGESVARFTRV